MKLLTALATALFVFAGGLPAFAQQDELAAAPRISLKDFKELRKTGNVITVDVRSVDSYKSSHLSGAISIPLADLQQRWKELPNDKPIVTYCG